MGFLVRLVDEQLLVPHGWFLGDAGVDHARPERVLLDDNFPLRSLLPVHGPDVIQVPAPTLPQLQVPRARTTLQLEVTEVGHDDGIAVHL